MSSIVEKIRQLQTAQADKALAAKLQVVGRKVQPLSEEVVRDNAEAGKRYKKERKLQHIREVGDKVLAETGILAELEEIKRELIDGKVEYVRSELVKNYGESTVDITLVWGRFSVVGEEGAQSIEPENDFFDQYADYKHIDVTINTRNKTININGRKIKPGDISNVLQKAFMNPRITNYTLEGDRGPGSEWSRSKFGG